MSAKNRDLLQQSAAHLSLGDRAGNFDLLRLIAATSVLFSHSFAIAEGTEAGEPLVRLLGHGNIAGLYGVYLFFIISGYLITASLLRSSLRAYWIKRCLRIFPGLVLCTALTATVATLFVAEGHPSAEGWRAAADYVARAILLMDTGGDGLPGLVFTHNDYGTILNGSLWSLGPEFVCYVAVAVLGMVRLIDLRVAVFLLAAGLITHWSGSLGRTGFLFGFFAAGAVLYLWEGRPSLNWRTGLTALAGLALGALLGVPAIAFMVFGSWLVIALATQTRQVGNVTRFGDLSYGIYLYGWPVEQAVTFCFGSSAAWWKTFLVSLPLAGLLALISWHLVEGPALRLAKRLSQGRSSLPPARKRTA
jgi:peptidoglycan/LPS O-acetylase OafA/YrhL